MIAIKRVEAMVMADYGDRSQRNRRRQITKYSQEQAEDLDEDRSPPPVTQPSAMTKVPKILAKPSATATSNGTNENMPPTGMSNHYVQNDDKPAFSSTISLDRSPSLILKGRGGSSNTDVRSLSSNDLMKQNIPGLLAADGLMPSHLHQVQTAVHTATSASASGQAMSTNHQTSRMASHAVKLIDETFCITDAGADLLLDQTDFLVVGVLGLQGVGKSTLMSALAGANVQESFKLGAFERGSKKNETVHTTVGIDMYVTKERTIILDSQPILSPSVLDSLIHQEKKTMTTATLEQSMCLDNNIELQSLQIATFMMTVCNVVVIVTDWFVDLALFKFVRLAEIMKPSTPGSAVQTQQNGVLAPSDESNEYYPHVVFVLNKAKPGDFRPECIRSVERTISHLMSQSKLMFSGMPSGRYEIRGPKVVPVPQKPVNLILLSNMDESKTKQERGRCLSPSATNSEGEELTAGYRGHRDFEEQIRGFTRQLLSVPRQQLTRTIMTEKNWLVYATRVWEVVRKSQLLAEYARLQP